ncbi:MAG: hypothetical protein JWO88_3940 [Frankiales bacterium]|nr:hypothetical protein [Frankiales bacterium]
MRGPLRTSLTGNSGRPTLGAMTHHDGTVLAQVGFLLILFAGVWLVAAQMPIMRFPKWRTGVAGGSLALAGVCLIIAVRAGHFG